MKGRTYYEERIASRQKQIQKLNTEIKQLADNCVTEMTLPGRGDIVKTSWGAVVILGKQSACCHGGRVTVTYVCYQALKSGGYSEHSSLITDDKIKEIIGHDEGF